MGPSFGDYQPIPIGQPLGCSLATLLDPHLHLVYLSLPSPLIRPLFGAPFTVKVSKSVKNDFQHLQIGCGRSRRCHGEWTKHEYCTNRGGYTNPVSRRRRFLGYVLESRLLVRAQVGLTYMLDSRPEFKHSHVDLPDRYGDEFYRSVGILF